MSDRLNYNTLAPAAMKALGGVHVYLHSQADLPKNLIDLAYLRIADQWLCLLYRYAFPRSDRAGSAGQQALAGLSMA